MTEPSVESDYRAEVRALLNEHGVIETYNGLLGTVIRCRTCGEVAGTTPLDALRRHDLDVLASHGLLVTRPGEGVQ